MLKTKNKTESSDENDDISSENCEIMNLPHQRDVIVNVEFIGSKSCRIMRLDAMNVDGDDGRYYSISYTLDTKNGGNGLFDFLDDYYSGKFGMFTSNKRIQSLLLALNNIEKRFIKDNCFSFREYCERINEASLRKISEDSKFSNVLGINIVDGYSIGEEATSLHREIFGNIGISGHIDRFGKEIEKEFDSILSKIEKTKFCCVCINNTDKLPPSFLIDPLVGLPLIVYSMDFADTFFKKSFRGFIESELFKTVEIDEISVDLWAVAPDATLKGLTSIFGEDGELKIEYNNDSMEGTDMFLGKYKTLGYRKSSYSKKSDETTVIGQV